MDSSDLSHYEFIIYDIFNTSPAEYHPFLMRNLSTVHLVKQDKVILYSSHSQYRELEQISRTLKSLEEMVPF